MASYKIEFCRSALKDLGRLDKTVVPRIIEVIDHLSEDPRPSGVRKLVGSDFTYRVRVGDYRIVYSIHDSVLVVDINRIRHRKDVYK